MSVTVRVQQAIEFVSAGKAGRWKNVYGPLKENTKHTKQEFMTDAMPSNEWANQTQGDSTINITTEVAGGAVTLTTSTTDDQSCHMGSPIIFNGSKNAMCESRISITDVSGTGLFVGFSDAKSETGSLPIGYPADSLTTTATDAVGFVIDADHATSSIMLASVKGDVDGTPVDTGVDWADAETRDLRIALDTSGNATFYINGAVVGRIASAVVAATPLLCWVVGAITRNAEGGDTVFHRRCDLWVDET